MGGLGGKLKETQCKEYLTANNLTEPYMTLGLLYTLPDRKGIGLGSCTSMAPQERGKGSSS